jgi:multiple sugar transport system substrate-binding protein
MGKKYLQKPGFSKKMALMGVGIGLAVLLLTAIAVQAVTINVLSVQDPFYFPLEKLLPEFEKETGIKVNLQGLAYDALHAKIITSFVGRTKGIDVVTVDQMWLSQYAENRWIIPLTPYIERGKDAVRMDEFVPEVIYTMNEWRGDIYTLPIGTYGQFVMYRTDLLEKAGLQSPPTEPAKWWTWDTYMDYVRKLDGLGEEIHGTVICGAQPVPIVHMYTQLAVSKGVKWFKQFPKAPWDFTPMIDSEENVEALKYYKQLYEHSPEESINYNWFDAGMCFAKKDIAIFFWWTPYGYLVRQAGYMVEEPSPVVGKYEIALLPHQPDIPQTYSLGGWSLGVPTYSGYKEEAWQFVKWATSKRIQKAMALAPIYQDVYQFNDFAIEPLFRDEDCLKIYPWLSTQLYSLKEGNGKITRPPIPIYTTLEGFYGLQLNMAVAGLKTPETALADAKSQFELALKQNFYLPFKMTSYDDTLERVTELIAKLSP